MHIIYYCLCLQYKYRTKNCTDMGKTEESQKMVLKDHYDTLSDENKIALRKEYMDATGMAYTTFYTKLRTDSFRPLERQLFEKMILDYKVPSLAKA